MATDPSFGVPPESKRVAVVAYTEYPWDPRVRREAEALVEDGYLVHVIALRPRAGASPVHLGGVHLHEVPLEVRRGGKIRYAYQYAMFLLLSTVLLLRLQLSSRFDLVHVHSLPDFQVFCALPLKMWRVPVLLDLHEAMPEIVAARFRNSPKALLPRVAAVLEQFSSRLADHVVVANDGIRAAVVSRGLPEACLTTVYNASNIPAQGPAPEEIRSRLGLPAGRLLVHAGGINPERDLETLLVAMARLPREMDIHLIVAGEGDSDYVADLGRLARDLGIGKQVQFLGKVSHDRAVALMSLATVGIVTLEANPLTQIAWPSRVTEFAMLRKPLIVPRLSFLRETLQEGAQYYEPGNPDSLARELKVVLMAPDRLMEAVAKAAEVCRGFEWGKMRDSLASVYRRLEGMRVA